MSQSYNYYSNQQPQYQTNPINYMRAAQPQMILKGRPVASFDEVRATSIDFDGTMFYFPDLANKRIYTKQINMDGTASINVFELKEINSNENLQPTTPMGNYVTKEEFEAALKQINSMFSSLEAASKKQTNSQEIKSF